MSRLDSFNILESLACDDSIEPLSIKRLVVAYSGGLDSHVLLHLLKQQQATPQLSAIHVNHQLSPFAKQWQEHAVASCAALNVPLRCIVVDVQRKGVGLEQAARTARYAAFEQELQASDGLMMAHHQDDQLETVFMRLMRGAGPRGLAGMPSSRPLGRAVLFRPLLAYSRAELEAYAERHKLAYITDESNFDEAMDRNFLRLKVLPLIKQRWPQYSSSWVKSAELMADSAKIIEQLAQQDYLTAQPRAEAFGVSVCRDTLGALSVARAKNLLRAATVEQGLNNLPSAQMDEIMNTLLPARDGAQPLVVWSGGEARRYNQRLYLLSTLPEFDAGQVIQLNSSKLELKVKGLGTIVFNIPANFTGSRLKLRFRQGGEVIPAHGGRPSKQLKTWLQEQSIPPWLRARLPLLFVDDQLTAIGDLWSRGGEGYGEKESSLRMQLVWGKL